jgi:hypothetical protein
MAVYILASNLISAIWTVASICKHGVHHMVYILVADIISTTYTLEIVYKDICNKSYWIHRPHS